MPSRIITTPYSLLHGVTYRPAVATLFTDESGRSGPDYLSPGQPIHVLAGYLVAETRVAELIDPLRGLRREWLDANPEADPELGAGELLRTPRWMRRAAAFVEATARAFPTFSVVIEKTFLAGIKFSQLFLDPALNRRAAEMRRDEATLKQIAEVFGSMGATPLREFRVALKRPCVETFKKTISSMSVALRNNGHHDLAQRVEAARRNLELFVTPFEDDLRLWDVPGARGPRIVRAGNSVDFGAHISCLEGLNRYLKHRDFHPARVIADQHEEQEATKRFFRAMKSADELEKLNTFETMSSRESDALQAADLLAGSLRAIAENRWPEELDSAADAVLEDWMVFAGGDCIIASRAFSDRLRARAAQAAVRRQRRERAAAGSPS